MPNAQQYLNNLDKNLTELNLANQNLEGTLTIQDFPNLESIKCGSNKDLKNIELINLPKLNYFHANGCQITDISVNNCPNITQFNAANNLLTDTEFLTNLNPKKLTHLSIHSNNFSEQDLSFLTKFTNLEQLFIDNHEQKKLENDIYNRFTGSLQPLQNLEKLKYLNIANTDIDSGLEHLPASVKKICLINSWPRKKAGYLSLKWELERAIRFPKVTERLQQPEENEPPFAQEWYRLAPWREAKKSHGQEIFQRYNAQEWLNQKYPSHTNLQHYKELIIADKNLVGVLDLSDFTNLEKLTCSYNRLTNLNLSKCGNLRELDCANNELADKEFLLKLPNKEKLEKLNLNNNLELNGDLSFLTPFIGLRVLKLSNCAFAGSLKVCEKMPELKIIALADTDIESGLDYLTDKCYQLRCNPDTEKKSAKIANILTKYLEVRKNGGKYYNLVKWREDWRNNIISSISTERLFVIRGNIKNFVNKWNKEADLFWYEFGKGNKLSKLNHPNEFSRQWWLITGVQWTNRAALIAGGSLVFVGQADTTDPHSQDYTKAGGIIAIISPFVETITSYINDQIYDLRQQEWDEFVNDTEHMLDNYHELLGILAPLKGYKLGQVSQALEDLRVKAEKFLDTYDKPDATGRKNGLVDITELTELTARKNLAQDLAKENPAGGGSQLGDIAQALIKLETEIGNYRRNFYYGLSAAEEKQPQVVNNQQSAEIKEESEQFMAQQVVVDLDDYFAKK